ncbi:hypothetical protein GY45DRAFT_1339250 [Cubamyces sp. BRFM 1775]|nr:hypothetical protein GY45DRAFT_1339250 [Cubamyces sp. BRFM 1775]
MPAFTTPAALRRLSRTGSLRAPTSPSSPANASTQPPTTAPTSTTSPGSDPSPSPRPSSPLVPLENESIVLRAARAYERDRQRVKKTKERAERERHKLQKQQQRATTAGGGAGPGSDGRAPRQHAREASARKAVASPGSGMNGADAVLKPAVGSLCVGVEEIIADVVERESRARGDVSPERPREVPLEELVKPGRARRTKAGEFEMIPGIPVVIALDEHIAEDAELDEPWEHISADELDEKRVAPPSYATVVATTA